MAKRETKQRAVQASHYVKVMTGQQYPACGPTRTRDNSIDVSRDLPMSESVATEYAAHARA